MATHDGLERPSYQRNRQALPKSVGSRCDQFQKALRLGSERDKLTVVDALLVRQRIRAC